MDNRKSFQRLLDHADTMVQCGQEYEGLKAMAEARMQYLGAIALLNGMADFEPVDGQAVDILRERVHGLVASICQHRREYEPAAAHCEHQLALHAKLFGSNATGLVDIYVSLSKTYLERLNKVSEARAAAEKACEIVIENGSEVSPSAIYANYYLCLCERSVGNKAGATVAFNRALSMLDANVSIISPVEAHVVRTLASEFA